MEAAHEEMQSKLQATEKDFRIQCASGSYAILMLLRNFTD